MTLKIHVYHKVNNYVTMSNVKNYIMTPSKNVKNVIMPKIRHDFKKYMISKKSMSLCQIYVITTTSTSWPHKSTDNTSCCLKVRHDVKSYVVTSKCTS